MGTYRHGEGDHGPASVTTCPSKVALVLVTVLVRAGSRTGALQGDLTPVFPLFPV